MRLDRLRLLRSPGIRIPFTLEAAPHVNLVTGPNGIGKSSLCRAVRSLLWPDTVSTEPFEAEARFTLGAESLRVSRRDAEAPRWDGGPRPNLGPDHLAGRYRLGVLDLLRPGSKDDPLAREIRRHMAGGFDLGTLRTDHFPLQTGRSQNTDLKTARAEVTRLRTAQQSLALDQDRLAELESERALAGEAHLRQAALETLRELIQHTDVREEAVSRLEKLPPACARVRPEDPEKLKTLRGKGRDLNRKIEDMTARLTDLGREREELLATGGNGPDLPLDLLKKKLEILKELARDVRQAEGEAGGAHQDRVLAEASVKPGLLPVILLLAVGAVLVVAGLELPVPGPFLPWALVALGGGAAGAGVWGLAQYRRGSRQAAAALDQRRETARKRDNLEACRGRLDEALQEFNSHLTAHGARPVADPVAAAQRLEEIADLRERSGSLEAESRTLSSSLEYERRDLERVGEETGEILDRLGLGDGPGSEAEAARLLELAPGFETAVRQRDDSARDIAKLSLRLAEVTPLLREGETPDMSLENLARLIEVEERRAAALPALGKEIADIEAAVGVARRGHDLQEALAAVNSAVDALAEVRQTNRESALGRMLLEGVERQHEKESRPRVLERAAEYFQLFTGGRYGLKMAGRDGEGDRFQALPEDSTQPRELDELSDGTRAQLLLAVKLAFMTVAEEGARPPIFLDDSLTSADPERFAAVAASLGRLAAGEDRQIFYLTPNPADVAAFQRALAEAGLAGAHHVDLAEVRGIAGAADSSLLDPANLPANLMAPAADGMNRAEYAAALKVPHPDPWAPWQTLHVLFVLGDNLDLVRRLVDGNAPTLGRFEFNRDTLVGAGLITEGEAALVAAGSDFWRAWLDGWRIGRARPVTREFLKESAAVSEKYLETVADVLQDCHRDGALLMEAIEARKVKGFRSNKREQLRRELEDADLLAHGSPLSGEELLDHTLARVAAALAADLLDMQKARTMALTFARMFEMSEEPASPPSS